MFGRILVAFLITLPVIAHAGATVYQCKTSNGVVFSDRPCDSADQTQSVKQYDAPRIGGEANPFDQFATPAPAAVSEGNRDGAPNQLQADDAPIQTAAYRCSANGKTWIQAAPCPSTSTAFVPVTGFSGFDQHGNYVASGIGTQRQDVPVEQQELSRSEACELLRAHMQTSERDKGQSSVYDRNKMRQADGC